MSTANSNSAQQSTRPMAAFRKRKLWISLGITVLFLFAAYSATAIWLGSNGIDIQFTRAGR